MQIHEVVIITWQLNDIQVVKETIRWTSHISKS